MKADTVTERWLSSIMGVHPKFITDVCIKQQTLRSLLFPYQMMEDT